MRRSVLARCFGLARVAGNALAGGKQLAGRSPPDNW
jgi:hypothetical protein